jgi:hypothetical protein
MSWVFPLCLLITLGVIVDMQMPCELFKREVKMDRLVRPPGFPYAWGSPFVLEDI